MHYRFSYSPTRTKTCLGFDSGAAPIASQKVMRLIPFDYFVTPKKVRYIAEGFHASLDEKPMNGNSCTYKLTVQFLNQDPRPGRPRVVAAQVHRPQPRRARVHTDYY